jgi:hypothetical protein
MPAKKTRLGDLAGIVGGPVAPSKATNATGDTENTEKTDKMGAANATGKTAEGEGKMQTIYLREEDLERAIRAEYELRASRKVPGRVGLSLLVRLGLDLISDELERDRDGVLERAARIAGRRP